jgi:hypothetical protein
LRLPLSENRGDSMEIVSAIIGMLGGLAMFLYGIEVMGDG